MWPTVALVVAAAISDLRSRRIPNVLTGPALLLGFVWSALAHGRSGLWQSFLGVLLAVGLLGISYLLGGMGMGDLKLFAAVGAWIGPFQLFMAWLATGLIGAVMGVCWALAGGFFNEALGGTADLLFGKRKGLTLDNPAARKMPYAPAIALGTICSFLGRHL